LEVHFVPTQLVGCLERVFAQNFFADLIAGVRLGLWRALAMAFAMRRREAGGGGIFTAVIAGFLISPWAVLAWHWRTNWRFRRDRLWHYSSTGRTICDLHHDGGSILLIMGRPAGTMIKYIPYPVTVGFTTASPSHFSTQIKDFFGLQLEKACPGRIS